MNEDMVAALERLKCTLVHEAHVHVLSSQSAESESRHEAGSKTKAKCDVLRQIEDVVLTVVKDISNHKGPTLSYASTTTWNDVSFERHVGLEQKNQRYTTVRFESLPSVKKFGEESDPVSVWNAESTYTGACSRGYNNNNVVHSKLATSKGCVAGDLVFQDADNNYIDCRHTQMGVPVPNHVDGIHNINTNANFILVVEKDATFQKLLGSHMCEKLHPCIMVTGKGFPDINTRMLLRKLWDSFAIPILALVDADPHGIEIMAIYKFGSRSLSFETNHLAVPCLRWLGILPSDIQRLGVPTGSQIPLTRADTDKCRELLCRPYMHHYPQWKREVDELISRNRKAEIQALDAISSSFLCDVYLPNKIRCEGWI